MTKKEKKIFSIGFNKCGTTTLNKLFLNNQLSTIHNPQWFYSKDLDFYKNYKCFTDGFERLTPTLKFPDLYFLELNFNCKFICLTRGLRSWLISRIHHLQVETVYLNGITNYSENRYDDLVILTWVNDRNYWYTYINNYFTNKSNLKIINIDNQNWINEVSIYCKLNNKQKEHCNKTVNYIGKNNKLIEKIDLFLEKYIDKNNYNSCGIILFKDNLFKLT
jgi:hypothetical protein